MRMKFGVILREVGMFNLCLLPTLSILSDKLSSGTRWSENLFEESGQQRVKEIKTLARCGQQTQPSRRKRTFRQKWLLPSMSLLCLLLRLQGWAMLYVTVWQIFLYFIFILQILTLTDHLPSVLSGPETSYQHACFLNSFCTTLTIFQSLSLLFSLFAFSFEISPSAFTIFPIATLLPNALMILHVINVDIYMFY